MKMQHKHAVIDIVNRLNVIGTEMCEITEDDGGTLDVLQPAFDALQDMQKSLVGLAYPEYSEELRDSAITYMGESGLDLELGIAFAIRYGAEQDRSVPNVSFS